jgi:hypothetical protein
VQTGHGYGPSWFEQPENDGQIRFVQPAILPNNPVSPAR